MNSELKELRVEYISLVDKPANRKRLVLKSAQGLESRVLKIDEELRRAYGIVYAPDEVDTQGDFASADTIRQAADEFMRERRLDKIDAQHNFEPLPAVWVAESWIVRQSDALFTEEGAWAVGIQINNPKIWDKLKKGELAGLSLAGFGKRDSIPSEVEMTEDDIKKLLAEALAPINERLMALEDAGKQPEAAQAKKTQDSGQDVSELVKALQSFSDKIAQRMDTLELSVLRKGRAEGGSGLVLDSIPEGFL